MTTTPSTDEFIKLTAAGQLRRLTDHDRDAFSGASERALIVETDELVYLLDLGGDGHVLSAYNAELGGWYWSDGEWWEAF